MLPIEAERAEFSAWLQAAPDSPYAAIYHQPFREEQQFGPREPAPLSQLPEARLTQGRLGLTLESDEGQRSIPRNRVVALGEWHLRVSGSRQVRFLTVFGEIAEVDPAGWYAVDSGLVVDGVVQPAEDASTRQMLGLDGVQVEGSLVGTFVAELRGDSIRLLAYRMPEPGADQDEISIFFRDGTSGSGTYPAGRFLTLRPLGDRRYRADFNRARNPFCAYNAIYPCPLPWRGNDISLSIAAGEKYAGGGLEIRP